MDTYAENRALWVAQLEGMSPLEALKRRTLIDAIDAEWHRREEHREQLRRVAQRELARAEQHPHTSAVYLSTLRGWTKKY